MPGRQAAADGASVLRLAHLLITRICHDLSGPLTGLGAAIGEMPEDPMALPIAVDAALALRRRMALLRAAWGEKESELTVDALRDLARGLPNAHRFQVDTGALAPGAAFDPAAARLVVNLMLLAAESLPGGGLLVLAGNPSGQIVATIAGKRACWPAGLGVMLASADAAWAAVDALDGFAGLRFLQGPLTALLAHQSGARAGLLMAAAAEQAPPLLLDLSAIPPD